MRGANHFQGEDLFHHLYFFVQRKKRREKKIRRKQRSPAQLPGSLTKFNFLDDLDSQLCFDSHIANQKQLSLAIDQQSPKFRSADLNALDKAILISIADRPM